MSTGTTSRNPHVVGLVWVGVVAAAAAIVLALVAAAEARRSTYMYTGPDLGTIAALSAWADLLSAVATVALVGAVVVRGARWQPSTESTD